ncbi:MAG: GAF domain-containing sensor histidine kinase [Desulfobacula sp.]|nr:GAF domain-containing sensor histidine kinase [Desulfobacula sp.]
MRKDMKQLKIDELKHADQVTQTLYSIANSVNTTTTLNALYEAIHTSLKQVMNVTNFFIAVVDRKKRTLVFPYHVDTKDADFTAIADFDTNDSLTGFVVQKAQPLLLKENEIKKIAKKGGVWGPVPVAWLGVPLKINREVIGIVASQSYTDPACYTRKDIELLASVSDQIAVAIDRKRYEELHRTNRLIAEQDKHALVGKVVGKMAHDFNNILGVIMGNTELALLDCDDGEIKQMLELILGQAVLGRTLTKNLTAFAKIQEPKHESFSINDILDLVVSLLKGDLRGIKLIKKYEQDIPDLIADPEMIEHAVVNLIQNCVHALSKTQDPEIEIKTFSEGNHICFQIKDNGCGIPNDHMADIFEPSFTLKGGNDKTGSYSHHIKGTGYGMSNVMRYIDLHKGGVYVESQVNNGTTFIIRLPLIEKPLTK